MKIKEQNERLRVVVSKCAAALGNGAYVAETCSIEFMEDVPKEIGLFVKRLNNDRQELLDAIKMISAGHGSPIALANLVLSRVKA